MEINNNKRKNISLFGSKKNDLNFEIVKIICDEEELDWSSKIQLECLSFDNNKNEVGFILEFKSYERSFPWTKLKFLSMGEKSDKLLSTLLDKQCSFKDKVIVEAHVLEMLFFGENKMLYKLFDKHDEEYYLSFDIKRHKLVISGRYSNVSELFESFILRSKKKN